MQANQTPSKAFTHAEQLREQGEFANAEQIYRRIISQAPEFHPAYHGLGLLAYDIGKTELAIEMIQKAIAIIDHVPMYYRI